MKTIFALSTVVLITFSLNTKAGFKSSDFSNDLPKSMVSVAPFVWGSPDDIIDSIKSVKGFKNLNVPVAPFVWGSPHETAPESLKNIKAENANVPVAPFVWGNPEETAPEI
ncbi:hypothetical protein [Daejeonella sp.]|uniref:hypothetical protein n=1 Tax=Daejeonella sp. TaxID=2805397 RepID=UPI00271D8456|nr:hypothetical protein [Daejeonella sp.]MDO8994357.1 hypothetical protein [Daejeonella sp.]MDP2414574.1 hypothetical protein [Daejeonella sp.]